MLLALAPLTCCVLGSSAALVDGLLLARQASGACSWPVVAGAEAAGCPLVLGVGTSTGACASHSNPQSLHGRATFGIGFSASSPLWSKPLSKYRVRDQAAWLHCQISGLGLSSKSHVIVQGSGIVKIFSPIIYLSAPSCSPVLDCAPAYLLK